MKEGQVRAEVSMFQNLVFAVTTVQTDRLKKYEAEIYAVKAEYEDTIASLTSKLERAENELQNLDSYKRDKASHDRKLAQVENELQMEKHQTVVLLEDQERKFLERKAQMMKEIEDQKYSYRESALKEARETMDAESRKLVVENKRISEELKFHNAISFEYQVEKDSLEASLVTARREVTLLTEKELEYARQNFLKTKEIKTLRERVEQLEKAQIRVSRIQRTHERA